MYFSLYRQNYCSYGLLNARIRKIRFLRIDIDAHFFIRDQKLAKLEILKVAKLHSYCAADLVLYSVQ